MGVIISAHTEKNIGVIWHLYECRIWVFRWACKGVNLTHLRCQWHLHWCQKDTFKVSEKTPWFNTLKVSFWHLKGVFLKPVKVSLTPQPCQIDPFTCSSEDPNATLVEVSNDTFIFSVHANSQHLIILF